ncbi:MAG: hypothetical protein N2167_11090 [Flavobacteriales bacterium]|nr:hypothetical protein [Flavobacteriales bacterium]
MMNMLKYLRLDSMFKIYTIFILLSTFFILTANSQISISVEDERIYKRFSKEQLEQWQSENPIQILYLNYLYKDSYVLKNNQGAVSQNIDPSRTDIMNFDHTRKENERVVYIVSPWGDYIELKSKKEVEEEFNLIKNKFINKN